MKLAIGDAAAAWSAERWVDVGALRVRFREAGSGPCVVLVHGLGISADYWFRNGPALAAAGYRVLAPDLPGFGRTRGPDGGLSVTEQAVALNRWADAMGLEPSIYVGHSLSCQAVLELAAMVPERVRGLVLAGPSGAPGRHRLLRQAWGLFLDAWREPWRLFPVVLQAYLRAGPVRFWRTWRAGARHEPFALLPRVTAPGIVVVGTRDPVVAPAFAEALAAGLPQGRVVWIAGAAHAVLFNRSQAFNRVLLRFVEELEFPIAQQSPMPAAAAGFRGDP
ncbi:MAG: alpha/beta hydrolase [Gemmatimonadota bacterium]|nr:alpha/beta hydrolase [Gemmatimonadota bacterium]